MGAADAAVAVPTAEEATGGEGTRSVEPEEDRATTWVRSDEPRPTVRTSRRGMVVAGWQARGSDARVKGAFSGDRSAAEHRASAARVGGKACDRRRGCGEGRGER